MFRDVPGCSRMLRDVPCSGFYRHPSITLSGIGINRITVRMTSYFNCGRSGSISETLQSKHVKRTPQVSIIELII